MTLFDFLKRNKRTEKLTVHDVIFVGEQDGPGERCLKQSLADLFAPHTTVRQAFLARARYGDAEPTTICLALSVWGGVDDSLAREIGAAFARLFDRSVLLDILALSSQQETQINSVCKPFYRRH